MTSYPQPPPSYQPAKASNNPSSPLLSHDELDTDIPEDFKIGVTVYQSSPQIRQAFVQKVYAVLFCQLLGTTVIGATFTSFELGPWFINHVWAVYGSLFLAFITMVGLFFKAQSHPTNIILLSIFTVLEAIGVGAIVCLYDQRIVLQALVITVFVFLGLTLFTFQSKYDFTSWGPYLFGTLQVFFITGLVGIFIPFSNTVDIIFAAGGCLLFSGYILYDTHLILNRFSPDDWVIATVSLYLDAINLFLNILRLLGDMQDR